MLGGRSALDPVAVFGSGKDQKIVVGAVDIHRNAQRSGGCPG